MALFLSGLAHQVPNVGTFLLTRLHLLCLQSQGDDARDHRGGHRGAGVAISAAVPEIRGDLWREELQPLKSSHSMGTTPSSTPDLLGCCQRGDEPAGTQPLPRLQCRQGPQSLKNGLQIHLVHKKPPRTYIFLCSKVQKLFERGKKSAGGKGEWSCVSWWVWVHVQGCMSSWAIRNTFLKASSS